MGLGRLLGHQGGFYAGGDYYGGSKRSRARRETVRSKEAARGKKTDGDKSGNQNVPRLWLIGVSAEREREKKDLHNTPTPVTGSRYPLH